MEKPGHQDYASFYSSYVKVIENPLESLEIQLEFLIELLSRCSEEIGEFKYAPFKWSVKELLVHCSDTERIFIYRLLRISRGDKTSLPGFEQDSYINSDYIAQLSLEQILKDFIAVRKSTLSFVRLLDESQFNNVGVMSGNKVSAKALLYIIAGHCQHHFNVLKQKYQI